jgi:hypothetical protein
MCQQPVTAWDVACVAAMQSMSYLNPTKAVSSSRLPSISWPGGRASTVQPLCCYTFDVNEVAENVYNEPDICNFAL